MTENKYPVSKEYLAEQIKNYDEYRKLNRIGKAGGICKLNDNGKIDPSQVDIPTNVVMTEADSTAIVNKDGTITVDGTTKEYALKDNVVNTVNGQNGAVNLNASNLKYDESNTIYKMIADIVTELNKKDNFPIGTIIPYVGSTAPDDTWRICGSYVSLSKTDYAELYALIGDQYAPEDIGIRDDIFFLPNLRGRFLEQVPVDGKVGTFIEAGIPDSQGGTGVHCTASGSGVGNGAFYWGTPPGGCTYGGVTGNVQSSGVSFKLSNGEWDSGNSCYKSSSGKTKVYGNSDTVQPMAYVINYIMKVKH